MLVCLNQFGSSSHGQLELLALENLVVVDVEEVRVQNRLNETSNNGNPVDLVLVGRLHQVSVDPVGNVQGAVATEGKEVVGGDGLGLASSLQHEQLGKNGHRLEPDGERPENLLDGVLVWEDYGEKGSTHEQVLDAEGIDVGIVGRLVRVGHEIDDVSLGAEEEDFEDKIVQAIGGEDVCKS